jgi:glycosyltransferase involved in cell wall biosynthesis
MSNQPVLSICIPAYNYGNYLPEAIESCLKCDFHFELIVLDNHSSDNTPSLKNKYSLDKRVKWFRNEKLLPVQENWNKCVSLTNGKYVKLLQADDALLPEFFDFFMDAIKKFPEKGIYGHLSYIIDENSQIKRKQKPFSLSDDCTLIEGNDAIKLKLRNIARFKEPSCNFFLRSAFDAVNGFDINFRYTFDINFNTMTAFHHGGVLINKYGSSVRRHSKSDGATLPMDLGLSELQKRNIYFLGLIKPKASFLDRSHANSLVQYRIIEFFMQRYKSNIKTALFFLLKNLKCFTDIFALYITASTIARRIKTGDVQLTKIKIY